MHDMFPIISDLFADVMKHSLDDSFIELIWKICEYNKFITEKNIYENRFVAFVKNLNSIIFKFTTKLNFQSSFIWYTLFLVTFVTLTWVRTYVFRLVQSFLNFIMKFITSLDINNIHMYNVLKLIGAHF